MNFVVDGPAVPIPQMSAAGPPSRGHHERPIRGNSATRQRHPKVDRFNLQEAPRSNLGGGRLRAEEQQRPSGRWIQVIAKMWLLIIGTAVLTGLMIRGVIRDVMDR